MSLSLPIYYVDAFTDTLFHGNPAAVVLLDDWLPDEKLLAIAAEINLPETAFLVGTHIRWFTPKVEVPLCGHATLASAFILHQFKQHPVSPVVFQSLSGDLTVYKCADGFTLDFPAMQSLPAAISDYPVLNDIIGLDVTELRLAKDRYICFLDTAEQIKNCTPDLRLLAKQALPGLIITAKSATPEVDFVSRFFAPAKGNDEDPVTGTSHCAIAPLWAERLNKQRLIGEQLSERGGKIDCEIMGERVKLTGKATLFLSGTIQL